MLKSKSMKKLSSILATLLVLSMLVPALAFAQMWTSDLAYDSATGSVEGTVYTNVQDNVYVNVYDANGNLINDTSIALWHSRTVTVSGNTYYYYDFAQQLDGAINQSSVSVDVYGSNPDNEYKGSIQPTALRWWSLSFHNAPYKVVAGSTVNSVVYATYTDLSKVDVTADPAIIYKSYDETVATVSGGVITGVSAGSTVVSATYQGKSAYASVTVSAADTGSTGSTGSTDSTSSTTGSTSSTTGSTTSTIAAAADGSVSATALANALAANTNVTITVSGGVALLPASALVNAKAGETITVSDGKNTYILPLSVLNLDALAMQLGVSVSDLTIKVTIQTLSGDAANAVNAAIAQVSGATKVADIVDFNVTAVSKDGKTASIDYGNTYVSRTLALSASVDASSVTGVVYDSTTGTVSFVPMTLSADGKTATLMRNGNSVYTVLQVAAPTFADIANHWAKADIQLLANKLIVQGVSSTSFEPDRSITRAEFAALAVRALGLTVNANATSSFSDVSTSAWYNGVVAAAAKAGLVNGYEDGTFRPDASITREELAALVVRALKVAGQDASVSAADQATLLASYSDANQIVWGQAELAAAVKAGIVNGETDTTLAPTKQATRAESATMLKRFLTKAGFIN